MSWIHADVVMLFIGLLVAMLVAVRLARVGGSQVSGSEEELALLRRSWTSVLHVSLLQGVVGYVQFFTGLPIIVVLTHMLLARFSRSPSPTARSTSTATPSRPRHAQSSTLYSQGHLT